MLPALLLLLFVSSAHSCDPNQPIQVSNSPYHCTFSFTNGCQNPSCHIRCQAGKNCDSFIIESTFFASCLASCCPNNLGQGSFYDQISQCASDADKDTTAADIFKILLIVVVAVASIMCFAMIATIIYNKCTRSRQITVDVARHQNPQLNTRQIQIKSANSEISQANLFEEVKWTNSDREHIADYDCVICLGESPNLELECGHLLHPKCFFEWWRKKKECPICRSMKITKLKLTCKKCSKRQLKIDLMHLKALAVKKGVRQYCLQCSK